ncbi:MAG: FmdB family zinc ribbon protein [Desulfovibrionaceae bacterium]
MPIYEYRCEECQQTFEEWQQDFEEREVPCPICGSPGKRMISNTSFILKGSGWYVTDYAGGRTHGGGNGNGNGKGEAAKADAPKTDAAPKADTAAPACAKAAGAPAPQPPAAKAAE